MNNNSYDCCQNRTIRKKPINSTINLLKLVSDQSRLQLLCILEKGTHCVCELMEHTHLSQSLISHHLKDLKVGGLVSDTKNGKKVNYELTPHGKKIVTKLLNLF